MRSGVGVGTLCSAAAPPSRHTDEASAAIFVFLDPSVSVLLRGLESSRIRQPGQLACLFCPASRDRLTPYDRGTRRALRARLSGTGDVCQRDRAPSGVARAPLAAIKLQRGVPKAPPGTESFPGNPKRPDPFYIIRQSDGSPHSGSTFRRFVVKESGWSLKPEQKTQSRLFRSVP